MAPRQAKPREPTSPLPLDAAKELSSTRAAGDERLSILVVDDDPDIRGLLVELLRLRGWRVEEACDGVDALAKIEVHPPRIVLLDQRMPGLSGVEVAAELTKRGCSLYVILMSAASERPADVQAGSIRAFLAKPFRADELLAAVHDAVL